MDSLILMLDSIDLFYLAEKRMPKLLERKVKLATTIEEAKEELVGKKYDALLVEPYYHATTEVLDFLYNTREEKNIPVVALSTQSEEIIQEEFGFQKNKHYDAYVYKVDIDSPKKLKKTLDALIK